MITNINCNPVDEEQSLDIPRHINHVFIKLRDTTQSAQFSFAPESDYITLDSDCNKIQFSICHDVAHTLYISSSDEDTILEIIMSN